MIDIRYHIYSLAAVFFALAVGIVIGTSFATRQPATRAEQRTIRSYANSMRVLKQEIENAAQKSSQDQATAKSSEEFCQAVLLSCSKTSWPGGTWRLSKQETTRTLLGLSSARWRMQRARVTGIIDMSREFQFSSDQKITQALADCGVIVPGGKESETSSSLLSRISPAMAPTLN